MKTYKINFTSYNRKDIKDIFNKNIKSIIKKKIIENEFDNRIRNLEMNVQKIQKGEKSKIDSLISQINIIKMQIENIQKNNEYYPLDYNILKINLIRDLESFFLRPEERAIRNNKIKKKLKDAKNRNNPLH
jgi:hypothetical protein